MIRAQIQFSPEQAARLRRIAARRGISVSAVVREAVEAYASGADDTEEMRRRALSAVGSGRSGHKNLAENHDKHLEEAFGD